MMLQLSPQLPLWHVPTSQKCTAFAILDYSEEHDLLFACIRADGEIWCIPNNELRGQQNITSGRRMHPADAISGNPYSPFMPKAASF